MEGDIYSRDRKVKALNFLVSLQRVKHTTSTHYQRVYGTLTSQGDREHFFCPYSRLMVPFRSSQRSPHHGSIQTDFPANEQMEPGAVCACAHVCVTLSGHCSFYSQLPCLPEIPITSTTFSYSTVSYRLELFQANKTKSFFSVLSRPLNESPFRRPWPFWPATRLCSIQRKFRKNNFSWNLASAALSAEHTDFQPWCCCDVQATDSFIF